MQSRIVRIVLFVAVVFFTASAHATSFVVDALHNCTNGGTGFEAISLTTGQAFSVTVDPKDLWNSGPLPRWSNANGQNSALIATGNRANRQFLGAQSKRRAHRP
jgi:hypothetical protein